MASTPKTKSAKKPAKRKPTEGLVRDKKQKVLDFCGPGGPGAPGGSMDIVHRLQERDAKKKQNEVLAGERKVKWLKLSTTERNDYAIDPTTAKFSLTEFPRTSVWHFRGFSHAHYPRMTKSLFFEYRGEELDGTNDYILQFIDWQCGWCFDTTIECGRMHDLGDLYDLNPTKNLARERGVILPVRVPLVPTVVVETKKPVIVNVVAPSSPPPPPPPRAKEEKKTMKPKIVECNKHPMGSDDDDVEQCEAGCTRMICESCKQQCSKCKETFCRACSGPLPPPHQALIRCFACTLESAWNSDDPLNDDL